MGEEVIAYQIRQKKKIPKGIRIENDKTKLSLLTNDMNVNL